MTRYPIDSQEGLICQGPGEVGDPLHAEGLSPHSQHRFPHITARAIGLKSESPPALLPIKQSSENAEIGTHHPLVSPQPL